MTWNETYLQWKNFSDLDEELQNDLSNHKEDEEYLKDAFYAPLEFGTAGMRGILGAGINRMNRYTVRQATEGLARLLETKGADAKKRGVAIAFDSRHYSPEFAMEAAKTLAKHQIHAYVFDSLRPTPELSFAVRELNCAAGIMITASHNPSAYNGYKVYGEDGGQMPPEDAAALTSFVRQVENPLLVEVITEEEMKQDSFIQIIGEELDQKYLEKMKSVTINQELITRTGKNLRLVFTPLHGAGKMLGERALRQAGFEEFLLVPEQAIADGDFPTVKSPNPEEHTAFEYAIALGEKEDAELLVATDPDADRLGAAVRLPNGTYQVLTGNQLGALMLDYILRAHQEKGTLPVNGVALKSIVSSELSTAIAENYGVEMVDVLTGFKFIAEKIQQYETDCSKTFMFGFEESYGYLVKSFVRDKDAIQALVLLSEVAAFYKEQDKNLYDALQDLFVRYGYFEEKTISITMSGIEGTEKIKGLMTQFRENSPKEFAGIPVYLSEDFQTKIRVLENGTQEEMTYPTADVLKYKLTDGSWLAIRPSGTEPKIKFYIAVKASSSQEAQDKVTAFEEDIRKFLI